MSYFGHIRDPAAGAFAAGRCFRLHRANRNIRGMFGIFQYEFEPSQDGARLLAALDLLHVRQDGRRLAGFERAKDRTKWQNGETLAGEIFGEVYETRSGPFHSSHERIVGSYYGAVIVGGMTMVVLELEADPCTPVDTLRAEAVDLLDHLL
jgi:hypothetical protein